MGRELIRLQYAVFADSWMVFTMAMYVPCGWCIPRGRSRICMVGDRLDTDVLFGTTNGLMSILTLRLV